MPTADNPASLPGPATFAQAHVPHQRSFPRPPVNSALPTSAGAPDANGQPNGVSIGNSKVTNGAGPAGAVPLRRPHRRIFRAATEEMMRAQARKHEGYQALSRFMASEDDFFVFRRFESINAEVILWLQDRITQLESELELMYEFVDDRCNNGSFRWNEENFPERTALLQRLYEYTLQYNQYIEAFSKIRTRPPADQKYIHHIKVWLHNTATINEDEASFLDHTSDLIAIVPRTRPPLSRWLGHCKEMLRFLKHRFLSWHVNKLPGVDPIATRSKQSELRSFTNFGIILVGLVMLLAPIWWLEYILDSRQRLGIITGFICGFTLLLTLGTVSRPFEVVAATAAYAAVLMVFMQIDTKAR